MDGRPRNNYPNGLGDPRGQARGPAAGGSRGPPSTASSGAASSGMSRAERFDDERKRITESCFSKTDDQGQLQESYITHIRVQEDASYPQSPPPPTSSASNKKGRIIMISVRNTGRVKLHKARENANGTFSIGKTWPMEDLSAVENFVHAEPRTQDEEQKKQWAGDKGFLVTISKPYYWEAGTSKEKEFFIGSMVKIYNKYTKGDFPVLTGFSVSELNSLTNGRPQLATAEGKAAAKSGGREEISDPAVQRQGPPSDQRPFPPKSPGPPPRRPGGPPSGPSDEGRRGPTPQSSNPNFRRPPGAMDGPRRPGQSEGGSRPNTGDDSRRPSPFNPAQNTPPMPSLRPRPSMEQSIRSRPSGESMRPGPPPARDPVPPTPPMPSGNLTPQSSISAFGGRPETPQSSTDFISNLPPALSPGRRVQADDARSQRSQRSLDEQSLDSAAPSMPPPDQRRLNGFPSPRRDPSPRGVRPGTAQSNASSLRGGEEVPPDAPPQRRRPFMEPQPSSLSQRSVASTDNEATAGTAFHMPSGTPPPALEPPPRRRPQDIPERLKPVSRDGPAPAQNELPMSRPTPPPTTPLPPPPVAAMPEPPAPVPEPVPEPPAQQESVPEPVATPPVETPPVEIPPAPVEEKPAMSSRFPMLKKTTPGSGPGDAANKFRKAAAAAGAFKPRAGGAAAKMFAKEEKKSDEPDGISGVFKPKRPAPVEAPKEEVVEKKMEEPGSRPTSSRMSRDLPKITTDAVPAVTISGPKSPAPVINEPQSEPIAEEGARAPTPEKLEAKAPEAAADPEPRKKKRRSNQQVMNISKLGIDPSIMDERGLGFESLLTELGWGGNAFAPKHIENLEIDIKREIARVEAGSWLNHLEQKDDRVEAVERMLDRAIAECDELEGLLTLYNVELSSLNDDIAFIEAQSQGLQVQTANQRLLQHELQQLVETISITVDQLEVLRRAPIGKINGLVEIENALVLLYKALITIDPAFVAGSRAGLGQTAGSTGFGNSELATMQALQEKRDRYLSEGASFLDRLKKHMEITYGAAFLTTQDALKQIDQGSMPSLRKNIEAHDAGRSELWMLSPVLLFAKEIDRTSWDTLIQMYQTQAAQLYQQEVRDNILAWRRFARKPAGDEQDLLFTTQEKEPESMAGTARKLTVKRSQTLARGLRSASGDKEPKVAKAPQDGKLYAFDVFGRVLDDIGPVLLTEQNFITEFFHATSTDTIDFPDAVAAAPPQSRRGPNLWIRKQFEADRLMAKRVADVMEDIFSFWPTEIQSLVDWAVTSDPLQGVGILSAVDRKLLDIEDSNQDFLTRTLQKIHERLKSLFSRFLDEQIRAIEDTKVKIKKRKGVIAFMKTFPHFSVAIENMLPSSSDGGDQLEIRRMVNDAYQRINKAMFESLKVIAKESPTVMGTQGQGDPEDKEALNYHILLIENMNHYMEEVDARPDTVLDYWKGKANEEYNEHMNLYVDAVIRRPLGKLLEFIESTETLLTARGGSPQSIAQRSSHSRSVFKKLVHSHDAKEVRKGIEALKKRVDKHFGDADDPSISRDLVFKVLKECERKYIGVSERVQRINQDVYQGEVEVDWGTSEVQSAFRR
ncbi:hypothetical protein N0V91_003349 [Didymella pomorum]|uniref:Exocyst complex component Sec3 PIP2-binding N-terminal domain-containing protein n=1 Tax=Didymella pomorum TaxID=749634 RepID=A0A9W8ZGX4_9PLEO|nr:hypothetical protein N0V91_003349 [Didymella pomorum]